MNRTIVATALALSSACSPCGPLADASVTGASSDVRDAIEDTLATFADDAGEVCIPEVVVESMDGPASIDRRSQRIWLSAGLGADEVPAMLRHELCHAWDFENGLAAPGPAWLDDLAADLFSSPDLQLVDGDYRTARLQRSEALAMFCGTAPPLVAATLAQSCAEEAPQIHQVHALLRDEVWVGAPVERRSVGSPIFEVRELALDIEQVSASPFAGAIGLHITYASGDEDHVELDPSTGEVAHVEASAAEAWGRNPAVSPAIPEPLEAVEAIGAAGAEAAAIVRAELIHLGSSSPRVLHARDEAWAVVDQPCELALQTFMLADGRAWTAWESGPGVVSVRPVVGE